MLPEPKCQICRHSKRKQIDDAIVAIGQRRTAEAFKISRQAIQRHLDPKHQKVARQHAQHEDQGEPIEDPTLAHDGIDDTPAEEKTGLPESVEEAKEKPSRWAKKRALQERRQTGAAEKEARSFTDYTTRKRYIGRLLRTGTFAGLPTLDRLRRIWPDVSMLGLAEITAQAAMEADFLRGTRQARRLVVLAKADKIYRLAMDKEDLKTALKALEFSTKVDGVSAEPDLVASLASSQAWAITARVLQAKFPEAFEAIHGELVAEESRKRQALAPMTVELSQDG